MSVNLNLPRYAGYCVDSLPKKPKVAVYLCKGKLQKWIPHKWICFDTPSNFYFNNLETGKTTRIEHKSYICDDSYSSSSEDCTPCEESIVRCLNIPGCDVIIRVPVVGNCPIISDFSEIIPLQIVNGFFVLDVSSLCCGGCVVLTYKSCVCGGYITVNQIIQRPCVERTLCPTLC